VLVERCESSDVGAVSLQMGITEKGKGGGLKGIAKFITRTHSAVK
jgi:hypothetical protein